MNTYRQSFFIAVVVLLFFFGLSELNIAQVNYNQRDDKYRLLGLKRAKELFEVARKEFDRSKELYNKKLISETEYDRAKGVFSDAEVNYQQSLLAVLFEAQFVSVEQAVKYQTKDGVKHIRLKLANTSGDTEEFRKLINIEDELFRSLQPDVIHNVYVSISNNENSIISQPYEAKINELKYGQPQTIDFKLLQDLDAVMVNIIYGNGASRSMKIYLQKDQSQNIVVVQSQQFSQEGELGKTATYDLTLELFSGVSNTFSLEVVNLPQQINRYFRDPSSSARLSQFKFMENVNTRSAALDISLPDRPSDEIKMDKAISFYVLVIPYERAGELKGLHSKQWTHEEIEKLNVGYVKLELVPRGKGRLLVKAPQLFYSVKSNEKVVASIELVNEGTRRLDNVEVKLDVPLNWLKNVSPAIIKSLEIGEEKRIELEVTPPDDIAVGRYEMRIRTTSLSDNQPVTADDKTITIEIQSEANVFGTILVVLLILGIITGIVIFGIKLSRK
ncbi:MAG: hypothetical protein IPM56_14130 [Ignavibacteriales bacterium]|nr:MAG: hypothetical protein IPM56_14130 [Ignavibacteriales bacterium]